LSNGRKGDSLSEKSEKVDMRSDHEKRQGTKRGEKKAPEVGLSPRKMMNRM